MTSVQEQIERLKEKIASWRNLRDDPDVGREVADKKIAELEAQLTLIQTGGGAFVAGDVNTQGGDFVGRDKITNIYQGIYRGPTPKERQEKLAIYRQTLLDRCGLLPLQGFSDQGSDPASARARLSLPGVYIQLNTDFSVEAKKLGQALQAGGDVKLDSLRPKETRQMPGSEASEAQKLSALHAAVLCRNLVLLGDPGSGKTTFTNYLAHCLAARDWTSLPDWPASRRETLPVLVTLRDFAYWLAGRKDAGLKGVHALWAYILDDLKMRNLEFAGALLEEALDDGNILLLLDGLDEAPPTPEIRGEVLKIVQAFADRYKKSRYLVTCRVLSYQEAQWQLPGRDFPALTLAPFDEKQIETFIHAWHTEIALKWNKPRQAVEKLEEKLRSEVARRADLHRLAPNPLLLTVMALVHTSDGELPEARALLYSRAVEILLWRWEQEKGKEQGDESVILRLLREAGRTRGDLLVSLSKLAYEAHRQVRADGDAEAVTGISEKALLDELRKLHPQRSLDWAEKVIEAMKLRAGLLVERTGGIFTLPHRTFQEYLAGVHLARQPNFAGEALKCVELGDFWRIVILLAVGYLVHANQDYEKPRLLVEELCPAETAADDPARRRAWLAAEVLLELGVNRAADAPHGQRLLARARRCLVDVLESGALPPQERLQATDSLGALGDPRFDEKRLGLPVLLRGQPEPLLGFVKIPAGKFTMGSAKDDEDASDDEKPAHTLELPEYFIARYPVTNAQYRHFMEAGGYDQEKYWTPAGWAWRNGAEPDPKMIAMYTKEYQKQLLDRIHSKPNRPYYWNDPQWGASTRPVVGICWYEALAYCKWLDGQLRVLQPALFQKGYVLRLPTEAEWEKAARGAQGNKWAWGNDWKKDHANINEAGLKETSPVGMFPKGATPDTGLLDISGDVWEWTHTRWGKDYSTPEYRYPYKLNDGREDESGPYFRTLRGGSWDFNGRYARCAARLRYFPDSYPTIVGFRCVVSLAISEF